MKHLKTLTNLFADLDARLSDWMLPTLARLVFAGVLLMYFWGSALTKLGDGLFGFLSPSTSAYVQIFPKAMEAVGYDVSQLSFLHWLVAMLGTNAEFVLPFLLVVGLCTRLAALGMIGFIVVQSVVDITGHGIAAADIGAWFDRPSGSLIADQRAFWMFLLVLLLFKGAGPISADRLLLRHFFSEDEGINAPPSRNVR